MSTIFNLEALELLVVEYSDAKRALNAVAMTSDEALWLNREQLFDAAKANLSEALLVAAPALLAMIRDLQHERDGLRESSAILFRRNEEAALAAAAPPQFHDMDTNGEVVEVIDSSSGQRRLETKWECRYCGYSFTVPSYIHSAPKVFGACDVLELQKRRQAKATS